MHPVRLLRVLAVLLAVALVPALPAGGTVPVLPGSGSARVAIPAGELLAARKPDPRWEFWTADRTRYTSPWYAGAHRIMIPFGCTRAPYYSPDPRCSDERGFHHGIDVAMPCGTGLFSARPGRVVSNDGLGPAYGANPLLLRNRRVGYDLVIAHVRRVYVAEGERVRSGQLVARASDDGAPDGCHLHFERRAVGGGLDSATHPRRLLALSPR